MCRTTATNSVDAAWVGLGSDNDALIQTGYAMNNVSYNGANYYFKPWYELLPSKPQYLSFTITTGDDLAATVQLDTNMGDNYYYLCIMDETTGYYYANDFGPYTPSPVTAEWIVETPHGLHIGSFGTEYFSQAYWWNASNPYTTYGINQGATWYHIKMNTPLGEHMTSYYENANAFYCQKTSN